MNMADGKKITPELLASMVELLPTISSLRDLCGVTGLRLDSVRREMAPFLAIMKLQGTHPQCGCGKDRFHPYGCVDSRAKSMMRDHPFPGHSASRRPELAERRRRIIEMLVAGDRFVDIDNALGLYPKSARKYLRFLSLEQRAERDRKVAARQAPFNEASR